MVSPLKQVGTFLAHTYYPIDLSLLTAKNTSPKTSFCGLITPIFFLCVLVWTVMVVVVYLMQEHNKDQ